MDGQHRLSARCSQHRQLVAAVISVLPDRRWWRSRLLIHGDTALTILVLAGTAELLWLMIHL